MVKLQIREHIAKAIQEADEKPCPDGYAWHMGYPDNDWLSDWGAFLADHIKDALQNAGYEIVPAYRCEACDKYFMSADAKKKHRHEKHTPHLKLSSKDRPANLGDVPCGHCEQTFANEWNAKQHRTAVHGICG